MKLKAKQSSIIIPEGCTRVLLHACCAPCSSAIVEWLLAHQIEPVIYYYNPNIYPLEEYEIRKNESKRHAESLGITWIDDDWRHESWRHDICGLENEPERGKRCEACFFHRLAATARKAQELGIFRYDTGFVALEEPGAGKCSRCKSRIAGCTFLGAELAKRRITRPEKRIIERI